MQMGRRRRFFYKFAILQKNRLFFSLWLGSGAGSA